MSAPTKNANASNNAKANNDKNPNAKNNEKGKKSRFSVGMFWTAIPSLGDLLNPGIIHGLLHCRRILYHLSHQGSPEPLNTSQ